MGAGTVSTYIARAREAGFTWPLPDELDDAGLERRLFSQPLVAGGARSMPDWSLVHQELKRPGVTLQLLWCEYLAGEPHG